MHKIEVFSPGKESQVFYTPMPPTWHEEQLILQNYPNGSWIDICRLEEDNLYFQDEVEADLEPTENIIC